MTPSLRLGWCPPPPTLTKFSHTRLNHGLGYSFLDEQEARVQEPLERRAEQRRVGGPSIVSGDSQAPPAKTGLEKGSLASRLDRSLRVVLSDPLLGHKDEQLP